MIPCIGDFIEWLRDNHDPGADLPPVEELRSDFDAWWAENGDAIRDEEE